MGQFVQFDFGHCIYLKDAFMAPAEQLNLRSDGRDQILSRMVGDCFNYC